MATVAFIVVAVIIGLGLLGTTVTFSVIAFREGDWGFGLIFAALALFIIIAIAGVTGAILSDPEQSCETTTMDNMTVEVCKDVEE